LLEMGRKFRLLVLSKIAKPLNVRKSLQICR